MARKTFAVLILIVSAASCFGMGDNQIVKNPPKNIIIMISDGCGYNHIETANLYRYGKIKSPVYEQLPVSLAMSTYLAGGQYDPNQAWQSFGYFKEGATDSAAAATAMSTGIKTYSGAIGVDSQKKRISNIVERCEELKMSTGVITSVQFSHATPAGFVAHNKNRGNYAEIAREMINQSACEVIMGCGHPLYDEDGKSKFIDKYDYVGGKDTFNAVLEGSSGGDCDGDDVNDPWTLIQSRQDFQKLSSGQTPKRVLGVAQVHTTLQQARSGSNNAEPFKVKMIETVPTLSEMASAAINVLDNDPNGFFLMIEGGAIDWASHANQSGRVIEEQISFQEAIETVLEWVAKNSNWNDTLLIVTSDHETGYLTGPDSGKTTWNALVNNGAENQPGFEWHSGGHTNQLVPFFAKGNSAELFNERAVNTDSVRGRYIDNTDIANTIFTLLQQR